MQSLDISYVTIMIDPGSLQAGMSEFAELLNSREPGWELDGPTQFVPPPTHGGALKIVQRIVYRGYSSDT